MSLAYTSHVHALYTSEAEGTRHMAYRHRPTRENVSRSTESAPLKASRDASSAPAVAAAVAAAALARMSAMRDETPRLLVDLSGVLRVRAAAESARTEGTVRERVRQGIASEAAREPWLEPGTPRGAAARRAGVPERARPGQDAPRRVAAW